MPKKDYIKMADIVKVYDNGVMANKHVDFSAHEGEIHAICGENGAGKSTLMKILFGIEQPSEGDIFLDGKKITIESSTKAIQYGIGMVHQHFMLVPSLTVAENVVLGIEPTRGLSFDKKEAVRLTNEIGEKYNLKVPAEALVKEISVGLKQRVEIIKALIKGAKILILDEPTAVLTPQETKELFDQLRFLRESGKTIIFISHKLNEVKQLCDRVTIMRNARTIAVKNIDEVTEADISRLMVGRDVIEKVEKTPAKAGECVLRAKDVYCYNADGKAVVNGVSFSARKGEILGFAGVEGNGQHEMLELITGNLRPASGSIELKGKEIGRESIANIRDLGLSYIPEDRLTYGVAAGLDISMNLLGGSQNKSRFSGKIFLRPKRIRENARQLIKKFSVLCRSEKQQVSMLSGGNMQKVVVAREFTNDSDLIVIDQPTRGIDVGTSEFIRREIVKLRDSGRAILLNSADLNEVLELSDSLVVFYNGRIVAYFQTVEELTEEELGLYMLGVKTQSDESIARVTYAED